MSIFLDPNQNPKVGAPECIQLNMQVAVLIIALVWGFVERFWYQRGYRDDLCDKRLEAKTASSIWLRNGPNLTWQ